MIEADDPKEARERLAARGILAESVRRADGGAGNGRRGLRARDKADFYEEIASLLSAGLTVERALAVLMDAPDIRRRGMRMAACRDAVRDGLSFPEAVERSFPETTPYESAVLTAGERAGRLGGACADLAAFFINQSRVVERTRTALIYPALVISFALLAVMGMLVFMRTVFFGLWADIGRPLPWLTRAVMQVGGAVQWAAPIFLLIGALAWVLRSQLRAPEALRRLRNRSLFRLPFLGRMFKYLVTLRFARTLSILVTGGVRIEEAFALAGRATGHAGVSERAEQEADRIRHGASVADAVRRIPPLSEFLPGWVEAGQAGGEMGVLLGHAADRIEMMWEQSVERSVRVIEPLLLIVVGAAVLLLALAVILPILSLNETIV